MKQIELTMKYASEGRVLIIAPKNIHNMTMLRRDKNLLQSLYNEGIHDAHAINNFIKKGM